MAAYSSLPSGSTLFSKRNIFASNKFIFLSRISSKRYISGNAISKRSFFSAFVKPRATLRAATVLGVGLYPSPLSFLFRQIRLMVVLGRNDFSIKSFCVIPFLSIYKLIATEKEVMALLSLFMGMFVKQTTPRLYYLLSVCTEAVENSRFARTLWV